MCYDYINRLGYVDIDFDHGDHHGTDRRGVSYDNVIYTTIIMDTVFQSNIAIGSKLNNLDLFNMTQHFLRIRRGIV